MNAAEQGFLDALDGLAYVTDLTGVVLAVGQPRWDGFAEAAAAAEARADAVLGCNLFERIAGEPVRAAWRALQGHVLESDDGYVGFEYRCDAPDVARRMRMSVSRLRAPDQPDRLLYQSQVLSAVSRPWVSLFEAERIIEHVRGEAEFPIVTMCGFCQKLAWPPNEGGWVEADTYYRLGGPADVRVSHGLCPGCAPKL